MYRLFWLNFFIVSLYPIGLIAQLSISGEIRPRSEYRHGFKSLAAKNQDAAFFIEQRSRINLDFDAKRTELFITLQDVRTWGNQPQLVVENGQSTGVHQAWAKVKFTELWAMKLGRQEISYDDQRILGNVGWAQQARSHDAALFIYEDSSFTGHLGVAFNQDKPGLVGTRYTTPGNYKSLQYIWLHKDWKLVKGSLLFLNNGVQVTFRNNNYETKYSQTVGGRLSFSKKIFSSNVALYYQGGRNSDTLDRKVNAYYGSIDAAIKLRQNITLSLGGEILSGNDQLNPNGENNAFTPFYGTNHKFNGLMDYFYVGNHVGSVGLNDFFTKVIYKYKNFDMSLASHYFRANSKIADPQDGSKSVDSYLGTEFDFTLGWKLKAGAAVNMGYSQMLGSSTMEILKGGDRKASSNWIWLMITVKPSVKLQNQ